MKKLFYILFFSFSFLFLNNNIYALDTINLDFTDTNITNQCSMNTTYGDLNRDNNYYLAELVSFYEENKEFFDDYKVLISPLACQQSNATGGTGISIQLYTAPTYYEGFTKSSSSGSYIWWSYVGAGSSSDYYVLTWSQTSSITFETFKNRSLDISKYVHRTMSGGSSTLNYHSLNVTTDTIPYNGNTIVAGGTIPFVYFSNFERRFFRPSSSSIEYELNVITNGGANDEVLNWNDYIPDYVSANTPQVSPNRMIMFDDGSYGFYQDIMSVHDIGVGSDVFNVAIVCEEDKPFNNGFCNLEYNDLINYNSDISYFNKSVVGFTQLFGDNSGLLSDDNYYLYSFRVNKPFTPQVSGLVISTNNGVYELPQENLLNVYLNDGGSFVDYTILFKVDNSNFTDITKLNSIFVLFSQSLDYYYKPIPNDFIFSVYRSFKFQKFTTMPTATDINNFRNNNDLSSIDGVSSQYSFFTDTDFNTFGFAGIITAPFRFLYALESYDTCEDLELPFPNSNKTITLKCVRSSIPSSLSPLITILQVVLSGIISYRIAVGVLSIIKDISSPDDANIEVVDL